MINYYISQILQPEERIKQFPLTVTILLNTAQLQSFHIDKK